MINGTQVMRLADGTTRDIEFGPPASAAFSQDAKRIALVSEGRDLKVYEGTAQVASAPLRVTPRDVFFTPDATGVVVATDRWLHLYRIGSGLILLQSSRQLLGQWSGSYKFIDGDGSSLFVVTGASEKYLRREEIHFTGVPSEAAIEGEPEKLIQEWSKKLGVTFSNDDILPDRVVSPVELSRPPVKPPPEPPGKPNPTEQTAPGGSAHG
jgi:hypothetical protein